MVYKLLASLIILLLPVITTAQANKIQLSPSDVKTIVNSSSQEVTIELNVQETTENLLILITDATGQTVFLENLHRFRGLYKKNVDLKGTKKGKYLLKVAKDDEKVIKNIFVQ
jgi:hypothetical protein